MMTKKARLNKCNAHEVLERQMEIKVKTLLLLFFLVMVFFVFCFFMTPQTYGFI